MKATLKVSPQNNPLVLLPQVHCKDALDSCDSSSARSVIMSSSSNPERKPWPNKFVIPRFSVETEMVLERANKVYRKDTLIKAHPFLKVWGSSSGLSGWLTSIKYKIANYGTKVRGFGIPDT